ncbi:MAG: hypothetical protein L0Y54_22990 [Sporichthyaceae bacterium]|nr:hypothetical protein [Sporichthyaceae bacterium]
MEVRQDEIDGVPVFWAPADGPQRAGLCFRVGRADETLARGGITHLIEHLVLHRVGQPIHEYQGQVEPALTMFATEGDGDAIRTFFDTVCGALKDLPMDRLELERNVLAAEAASRPAHVIAPLLPWRYGAATFGLPVYDEFGLSTFTPDDLRSWVATWFTRGNATMWVLGGPPPVGLALDLPDGPRRPVPQPSNALPTVPAYFNADVNGIAMSTVLPRTAAGPVYSTVLERELRRELRHERALSYTPWVAYEPRDAQHAHLVAFADGMADNALELTSWFVNTVERLADVPPADEVFRQSVQNLRENFGRPEVQSGQAYVAAVNTLHGAPVRTLEQVLSELDAVTPADVRDTGRIALGQALYMLPSERKLNGSRYVPAPKWSDGVVAGRTMRSRDWQQATSLVVGASGVSLTDGTNAITVRFDECAVVLAWPDGRRSLIGSDALGLNVEPTLWRDGLAATAEIDRRVRAALVVPMPARAAADIPKPPGRGWNWVRWRLSGGRR